ncbi:MAG TPA: hypothetical protein VGF94_23210 [Kofleriaceae bacterium]
MLLFKKAFHAGLVSGAVRLTFRAWDKPHVRAGGRYRCHPIGVLEVDRVSTIRVHDIPEADARLAGFASRDELIAYMNAGPRGAALDPGREVFRVELHHGGDGDRVAAALEPPTADELAAIRSRLARFDREHAWTLRTLRLIERHPHVAASKLAAELGRETQPFKIDVRKLKKLGLTQSFEVGYELSPRGRVVVASYQRRSGRAATRPLR